MELGILREADQLMTEPLPRPTEEQGVAEAEAGTEDDSADEVFTQVPSWQTNHLEFLKTCQGEQQLQKGTKRARKQEGRVRAKSSRSALRVDENRTLYFALLPFIRRSFSLTRVKPIVSKVSYVLTINCLCKMIHLFVIKSK